MRRLHHFSIMKKAKDLKPGDVIINGSTKIKVTGLPTVSKTNPELLDVPMEVSGGVLINVTPNFNFALDDPS